MEKRNFAKLSKNKDNKKNDNVLGQFASLIRRRPEEIACVGGAAVKAVVRGPLDEISMHVCRMYTRKR